MIREGTLEMEERVMRHIQENEALDLTRSLIKIHSDTGSEKAIGIFLSKELTNMGIPVQYAEAKEGRPNVISHVGGETADAGLILVGHIDTVPVSQEDSKLWDLDPFDGALRNGCIYGLGASDMKGGIASILLAVKAVLNARVKLKKGLTIIFCVDEERGSTEGMRYISEKRLIKGNLAMEAEPTDMCFQGWFKGRTWYEIETRGKAAHTSNPAMGVNAIHHMAEIINKIKNSGFNYEKHQYLGDYSINFGTIEGGTGINAIPDLCKSKLEVRTVPGQTGEGVKKQIEAYISELKKIDSALDARVKMWEGWYGKDPMDLPPTDPIFNRIQRASQKAIGTNLKPGRAGMAGGDIYFLWKNLGIPGVYFGPGDIRLAHSPNEYVKLENIMAASKCYAAFILEFCEGYFERS
jgi:acetylornithine deacetylase/succinyl-diaminopimelate desuccinylase family protein